MLNCLLFFFINVRCLAIHLDHIDKADGIITIMIACCGGIGLAVSSFRVAADIAKARGLQFEFYVSY